MVRAIRASPDVRTDDTTTSHEDYTRGSSSGSRFGQVVPRAHITPAGAANGAADSSTAGRGGDAHGQPISAGSGTCSAPLAGAGWSILGEPSRPVAPAAHQAGQEGAAPQQPLASTVPPQSSHASVGTGDAYRGPVVRSTRSQSTETSPVGVVTDSMGVRSEEPVSFPRGSSSGELRYEETFGHKVAATASSPQAAVAIKALSSLPAGDANAGNDPALLLSSGPGVMVPAGDGAQAPPGAQLRALEAGVATPSGARSGNSPSGAADGGVQHGSMGMLMVQGGALPPPSLPRGLTADGGDDFAAVGAPPRHPVAPPFLRAGSGSAIAAPASPSRAITSGQRSAGTALANVQHLLERTLSTAAAPDGPAASLSSITHSSGDVLPVMAAPVIVPAASLPGAGAVPEASQPVHEAFTRQGAGVTLTVAMQGDTAQLLPARPDPAWEAGAMVSDGGATPADSSVPLSPLRTMLAQSTPRSPRSPTPLADLYALPSTPGQRSASLALANISELLDRIGNKGGSPLRSTAQVSRLSSSALDSDKARTLPPVVLPLHFLLVEIRLCVFTNCISSIMTEGTASINRSRIQHRFTYFSMEYSC